MPPPKNSRRGQTVGRCAVARRAGPQLRIGDNGCCLGLAMARALPMPASAVARAAMAAPVSLCALGRVVLKPFRQHQRLHRGGMAAGCLGKALSFAAASAAASRPTKERERLHRLLRDQFDWDGTVAHSVGILESAGQSHSATAVEGLCWCIQGRDRAVAGLLRGHAGLFAAEAPQRSAVSRWANTMASAVREIALGPIALPSSVSSCTMMGNPAAR